MKLYKEDIYKDKRQDEKKLERTFQRLEQLGILVYCHPVNEMARQAMIKKF